MTASPEDVFGKENIDRLRERHKIDLQNKLADLDIDRGDTVKHFRLLRWVSALIGIPALLVSVYGIVFIETHRMGALTLTISIFISITALMVVVFLTVWPAELTQKVKKQLTGPVIAELGYQYSPQLNSFNQIRGTGLARDLGLFKAHDHIGFDEFVSGERSGFVFEMLELQLIKTETHKGNQHDVPVFWGQCFFIQFDKPFLGTTVATRRSDFMSWRRRPKGLSKVRIESPVMRKKFRLSSSDQTEARYLLTPDVLERLDTLERRLKGKKLRFGFRNNGFVIVLEKANLFDPDPYKTAYASKDALDKVLDDMAAIATLFDTLAASHKRDRV